MNRGKSARKPRISTIFWQLSLPSTPVMAKSSVRNAPLRDAFLSLRISHLEWWWWSEWNDRTSTWCSLDVVLHLWEIVADWQQTSTTSRDNWIDSPCIRILRWFVGHDVYSATRDFLDDQHVVLVNPRMSLTANCCRSISIPSNSPSICLFSSWLCSKMDISSDE